MQTIEETKIENALDEFVSLAAQFDVLCAFFHGDGKNTNGGVKGSDFIREVIDRIKEILTEDRDEFSIVSCDLDQIWQTFHEMEGLPSSEDIDVFRESLLCIRDTIYFTEDGSVVSLGFKFELWRIHFIQFYMAMGE